MEKQLAIYVSASAEMDPECELLGQLLANMTPSIRWIIKRTPAAHENANPDLSALQASQFYLLLMGTDIVAPVGVEWMAARGTALTTFAYHNANAMPTPAASVFMRNVDLGWEQYRTGQEFIRHLERALITTLIRGTPGYGLELADLEQLSLRLSKLDEGTEGDKEDDRRGASRGGVILPSES